MNSKAYVFAIVLITILICWGSNGHANQIGSTEMSTIFKKREPPSEFPKELTSPPEHGQPISMTDVDIHHPMLTRCEAIGIALAKDKVERYIAKGRIQEAQGAASVTMIVYQSLLGINDIDTGWGEL
jgi:hypothetical protein